MRSCSRASPQGAHEHVCEPLSEHSSSKQGVDEKLLKLLKCERQSNTITPGDNFGSECTAGPGLRQKRFWRRLRVFPGAHPQKYPDGGSRLPKKTVRHLLVRLLVVTTWAFRYEAGINLRKHPECASSQLPLWAYPFGLPDGGACAIRSSTLRIDSPTRSIKIWYTL